MPRILLVEDETSIADTLVYALETEHFEVTHTTTAGEALELLDASDGEVLAIVAERQRLQSGTGSIDSFSMPTNSATVFAEVRRWARRAASKLRTELDKAVAGK